MAMIWKIIYKFPVGLEVEKVVESYPKIGLLIKYSGNKLVEIHHELAIDDALHPSQVMALSRAKLKFFWMMLQYRYGLPLPQTSDFAERISPESTAGAIQQGYKSSSARASICLRIKMPDPTTFPGVHGRLPVYLALANDSYVTKNLVEAIRNYYMILEDIYPDFRATSPSDAVTELIHVRDFVSHAKIKNTSVLGFIRTQLGKQVDRFDPLDAQHQALVNKYRQLGRRLVDQEINKLL